MVKNFLNKVVNLVDSVMKIELEYKRANKK